MFLEFDITYYFCYGEKSVKLFQYKTLSSIGIYFYKKLSRVRTETILGISIHVRTREKVFRFYDKDSMSEVIY